MLKICKSCKALVDTNKHDFCPKCGANFNFDERKHVETNLHNEKLDEQLAQQRRAAVEKQMQPPKESKPKHDPYKYNSHEYNNQQSEYTQPVSRPVETFSVPNQPSQPENSSQSVPPSAFDTVNKQNTYGNFNTYTYGNQNKKDFPKPAAKNKKGGAKGCITLIVALCTVFPMFTTCVSEMFEEEDYDYSVEYTYPAASLSPVVQIEKEYEMIYDTDRTREYEISCFDMRIDEEFYFEPAEGYVNVAFGLVVENITSGEIDPYGFMQCSADGVKNQTSFGVPSLPAGGYYEGYVTFQIPKSAKVIKLTYDKSELRVDNIFYEEPVLTAPEEIPPPVDADFMPVSVYNSTSERSLCCNGVKYVDALMGEPADGNVYMAFNIIVGVGKKGAQIYDYPVCYADGAEAEMCTLTKYGIFMPGEIDVNGVFEGVVCFEVPENTMNFRIEYEGVTLEFENPLNTDYIDVELYEFAEMGDIAFACASVGIPQYMPEQPKKEGYDYILLEFYALNQGNETVYNQDIPQCYVNGELMEINYDIKDNIFYIGELNPTEGARGYVCYEIPTDAQQLEIIFSERVKITIDGPFFQ